MKKLRTLLAVFVVLALIAAACGDGDAETTTTAGEETTTTVAASGDTFRIAIVAPSAQNDLAFTQSIVDAVNVIAAEMGNVDVQVTDGTFVVEDAAGAIRAYAESGVDLVIAHGSQYGGSLQEIAPDFPDTSFAWGTAADTFGQTNVFAYEAASDEGGYVMGVMGAALSESNVIGIVGPIEVGDAKLYVDGYKAGVLAQNPDATVLVNYTDSFSDVALASEAAQAHAANDADVMSGTAQMVVGAITVANDQGILWFGTQANQKSLAPDIVVASQVYHWEVVLRDIIANIENGVLGGEQYVIDLANGGEVIEYNEAYDLPADVKTLADETIAGIIDGSISTGG
jgi:basic membrane protein A